MSRRPWDRLANAKAPSRGGEGEGGDFPAIRLRATRQGSQGTHFLGPGTKS